MGYFSQPSDLKWFNALLQFSTSIGEINTELLHKQRTLSFLRKQFTSLFGPRILLSLVWAEQGSLLAADWLIRCKQMSWLADRQSCDQSCVWAGWGIYLSAFNQSASRRRTPYCRNRDNENRFNFYILRRNPVTLVHVKVLLSCKIIIVQKFPF